MAVQFVAFKFSVGSIFGEFSLVESVLWVQFGRFILVGLVLLGVFGGFSLVGSVWWVQFNRLSLLG